MMSRFHIYVIFYNICPANLVFTFGNLFVFLYSFLQFSVALYNCPVILYKIPQMDPAFGHDTYANTCVWPNNQPSTSDFAAQKGNDLFACARDPSMQVTEWLTVRC